jgi:hypothetical protein
VNRGKIKKGSKKQICSGPCLLASLLYWLFIVALCIVFADVAVRLWGLSPLYSLYAKGLDYALPFVLDGELLYRFLPETAIKSS